MAAVKTYQPFGTPHGKLHKRNLSSDTAGSFTTTPIMAQSMNARPSLDYKRNKVTYEDEREEPVSSTSLKMKPVFRKLSTKDSGFVDLSRPAAENEGLAGLGIAINGYPTGGFANKSANDVSFVSMGGHGRSRHIRSPSNTSQLSATTSHSIHRPNGAYSHPMRQTPRPYTPPISKSYSTSIGGRSSDEDFSGGEQLNGDNDIASFRQLMSETHPRSSSFSSSPHIAAPAPLHIRSSDSITRFTSPSQTSLHATRSRGATLQSVETLSPSSRPSIDKAFNFFRQRSAGNESELDQAASHAASMRAARLAYQEKEEAKNRKADKEEARRHERETEKQNKKEERVRRKSEADERRTRSNSNEKNDHTVGREYSHLRTGGPFPRSVDRLSPGRKPSESLKEKRRKKGVKRGWFDFVIWFKTRILRIGRRKKRTKPNPGAIGRL
jgi:hypothetical protein